MKGFSDMTLVQIAWDCVILDPYMLLGDIRSFLFFSLEFSFFLLLIS